VIAAIAAVMLSASDVSPRVVERVVAAAKKKKPPPKKDKGAPAETSEGLDLTASEPVTKTPETTVDTAPPSEEVKKEEEAPAEGSASAFSVVTPITAGEGQNLIEAGVGWPGVYASYWRGILANLDAGARVQFNWSLEGQVTGRPIVPGLKIQLQGRYNIMKVWKLDLGVIFAPGFVVYFVPVFGARPGVIVPVTAVAGMNLMEKLNLGVTLETGVVGLPNFGATIPIVLGAAAEYFLTDALVLQARIKPLGIGIWTNGAGVVYTFEALVGAAYKL
jgi:hypothetical protein